MGHAFANALARQSAGHNNLPEFPEYHDLLYDILHEEASVFVHHRA